MNWNVKQFVKDLLVGELEYLEDNRPTEVLSFIEWICSHREDNKAMNVYLKKRGLI